MKILIPLAGSGRNPCWHTVPVPDQEQARARDERLRPRGYGSRTHQPRGAWRDLAGSLERNLGRAGLDYGYSVW